MASGDLNQSTNNLMTSPASPVTQRELVQTQDNRQKVDFYGLAEETADEVGKARKMRGGSSDCKIQRPSHTLSLADMRAHKDESNFTVKAYITPKGETTGARLKTKECYSISNKVKHLSFFEEHAKQKK